MDDRHGLFNTSVERDAEGWCIVTSDGGKRRVVSRHGSEQAALQAQRVMNESNTRADPNGRYALGPDDVGLPDQSVDDASGGREIGPVLFDSDSPGAANDADAPAESNEPG